MGRFFFRNNTKHWNEILCLCVQLHAYGFMWKVRDQTQRHFSRAEHFLFFWGNLSLRLAWMELMDWAKLAGQREAGGLPVSILHCCNYKHASPHLGFTWMLRVKFLSSCFHDKHVISPPVSLAPKKLYWKEDFAEPHTMKLNFNWIL